MNETTRIELEQNLIYRFDLALFIHYISSYTDIQTQNAAETTNIVARRLPIVVISEKLKVTLTPFDFVVEGVGVLGGVCDVTVALEL